MAVSPELELASSYFETRLLQSREAQQLPVSAQFDLARSPLSDDELEGIVDQFRDTPRSRSGWGISEMLGEVLSTQPKSIPVQDLTALQNNLIAQGYASPNQVATGSWDPSWYASLRRFDRDNYEKQRQGYHWYSAPVMSGINAMTNTLPSRVFQGIVGAAKGLVMQAPESAERLGVLGSAGVGAGIGALAGGPVGALIGAGVGAIGGVLSEAFFDDEEGEDETGIGAFLEVLAPWGEYQKPQELWEDLGFVLTAASVVSGAGAAVRGVTGGAKALGALRAGGEAAALPEGVSASAASAVTQPMSLGRALMAPTASKELGVFGTLARAATQKFVPGSAMAVSEKLARWSPIAFMNRTGPKIALDVFGGVSQAQMGARLFGGLGQGSKQKFLEAKSALEAELGRSLTEDEMGELSKKTATSTIEKAIAEAPLPQTGIDIPLVGDAVDIAAFALYPQRLLPFGGGRSLASSAVNLMGDTTLAPYVHAQIMGQSKGVVAGRREVLEQIDAGADVYMRLDYGIQREAGLMVDAALKGRGRPGTVQEAWRNARAAVRKELHDAPSEDAGKAIADRLLKWSYIDDTDFTRHLVDITAEGRGLNRWSDFLDATRYSLRVEKEVGENTRYVRDEAGEIVSARADLPLPEPKFETFETPAGPVKQRVTTQEVKLGGVERGARNIDVISVEQAIRRSEQRITAFERQLRRVSDPHKHSQILGLKVLEEAQISQLKRTLKDLKGAAKKEVAIDRFRITPARQDTMTRQVANARKAEYATARKELVEAGKEAGQNPMRLEVAVRNHENLLESLTRDGIIDEVTAGKARTMNPGKAVERQIEQFSRGAASDVELPEHMMAEFDRLGYKPVTAGDDVLSADEVGRLVDLSKHDVGDYTTRAAVWETLALSPKMRTDKSLFGLRRETEKAELGEALMRHGVELSPDQAFRRLKDYMEAVNHEGSVIGPGIFSKTGRPRLYKVDPRDLTVDDIFKAFEDVPGFTDDTARDVYGALRRGAAYGHELRLLHPVTSAYGLGQLLRLNGLPGFGDLVRTWNLQVPTHFDRAGWAAGKVSYKAKASADKAYDLAHSVQRARAERALKDTALVNGIPEQQRDVAMWMLDSVAEGSVRHGRFKSVDEFYKHLDVEYAKRYVEGEYLGQPLFQKHTQQELQDLFEVFEEGNADWYERAHNKLREVIPLGSTTKHPAMDEPVDDFLLFNAILAATSPRTPVADNMRQATEIFQLFKQGRDDWGSVSGVMSSKHNMLNDIAQGKLPDQWVEPFRTTRAGAPAQSRSRMKVYSFYQNLVGDLEQVTVDTWMANLYGLEKVDPRSYDEVRDSIRALADELTEARGGVRVYPAQVQAALWAGAKHLAVADGAPRNLLDATSFDALTDDLQRAIQKVSPAAVFKIVDDEVRGLSAWGNDGLQIMRFFRDADFTTLVHENAHILRRLLAPEDLTNIERAMGLTSRHAGSALPSFKPVKLPDMRQKSWRESVDNLVRHTLDEGGATWDPRTGQFKSVPGHGAVAMREGTDLVIPASATPEQMRQQLSKFAAEHRKELENPEAFLGTWKNDAGDIEVDVSEVIPKAQAAERAELRQQKAYFDMDTFEDVAVQPSGVWDVQAEERFAEMAEKYFLGKADPESASLLGPLRENLRALWGNARHEAVNSNFIGRGMRKELDKLFPIPEQFAPPSIAKSFARGSVNRQTAGGALIGGLAGAYEGREDGILDEDVLAGAAFGAAGGLVARKLGKRNYGYLPDSLMRMNTALRYSLSFSFDLGRLSEQNMIAMAKHQLPPMLSPKKYTTGRSWRSPYRDGEVTGEQAWKDAVRFWDELNGTNIYASIDDLDRRLFQRGMLGFSPRNWETAQAWQLYQRGWGADKIEEAVSIIGRYGVGRTAAEKSANFVIFPFSFSKKFLTTLGDFVLQAPGRNLLLHEAARRYYESEADEKFNDFMSRRLPFLQELATVNNLAFGISPGRFFLQGLSDHRTNTAKAAQAIASFFVPSGAATSLAQAAGNAADLTINAFVPIVITGESINKAGGINGYWDVIRRYIPFIREVDQYFVGAGEMGGGAFSRQVKAFMEGGDPYWQFTNYQEGLKMAKADLEPLANALGYASVDGLLQSDQGAVFQQQYDAQKEALRQELPTGFAMSQTFENQDAVNAAGLMDLANKTNRSPAEDQILRLTEQTQAWQMIVGQLGLDPELMATMQAAQLRESAMQHVDDPRFVELWNRFYLRDYGPIRRVA